MKKIIIVVAVVFDLAVLIILGLGIYKFNFTNDDIHYACTQEAKICPDSSAVGRTGPKCEFAACPKVKPPVTEQPYKDLLQVSSPAAGETVGSPLIVSGIARGSWYFETSFPVRLLDNAGKELAAVPAAAQGNWMTNNFVPFIATLDIDAGAVKEGKLILKNDNPSGLPENDKSIEIPLKFAAGKTSVKVYFGHPTKGDLETECEHVVAVGRTIATTSTIGGAALEELFKGPTSQEKALGYITSINSGVKIQKLTIENKVAKVDLSKELEYQLGGSCRVAAISAQITETLKQFPTVTSVIISVDGRTEDILQP